MLIPGRLDKMAAAGRTQAVIADPDPGGKSVSNDMKPSLETRVST